jgi:hypothetical protein
VKTDRPEPHRATARKLKELPRLMNSTTEAVFPADTEPLTLSELPTLVCIRTLQQPLTRAISAILSELPTRAKARMERDEPSVITS